MLLFYVYPIRRSADVAGKFLFVGTYLSERNGSLAVSESIANHLVDSDLYDFDVVLLSRLSNKYLRAVHLVYFLIIYRFDKVHVDVFSGNAFINTLIVSLFSRIKRFNLICTVHGGAFVEFYSRKSWLVDYCLKRKNVVVLCPSKLITDTLISKDINVAYHPNPVKISSFSFNRDNVTKHSILWVRAFSDIYNPIIAVKSFSIILRDFPDATLTMIGPDKGSLSEIECYVKEAGLEDKVSILGPVANNLLYKYYSANSVYINTTSYESFGMSVCEAASCGIPIVSSNVGELPYLWSDNSSILFVDSITPNSFAEKISDIFKNTKLSSKLSHNAQLRVADFEFNQNVQKWLRHAL